MPVMALNDVTPERHLNGLKDKVFEAGWEAMHTLMVKQWHLLINCWWPVFAKRIRAKGQPCSSGQTWAAGTVV